MAGPAGETCCQAATCSDGVTNGTEPVADCGNGPCGPCNEGHDCTADEQCATQICVGGTCGPAPSCADGLANGEESDVDCGGPTCEGCSDGQACDLGGDCQSGQCLGGACACGDGQRNGDESSVDCGGSCGACGAGQGCGLDTDCASGACLEGLCCGGAGLHCTRCAARLSPDRTCAETVGETGQLFCAGFLACLAQNPAACPTRSTPGCIDDPGGACNHNTFGGATGLGIIQADAILSSAGCAL
jgi:hypothetical protein